MREFSQEEKQRQFKYLKEREEKWLKTVKEYNIPNGSSFNDDQRRDFFSSQLNYIRKNNELD